jgi:amino-acid N-acetyltransferase
MDLAGFVVGKSDATIVGVIGLEVSDRVALVRSLAVEPSFRSKGIARELNTLIFGLAQRLGVEELYLLTLTASDYFAKLGFQRINRDDVPEPIQATNEFRRLCPQTAVCMMKRVSKPVGRR